MEIERNATGEAVRITMRRWFDAHLHLRHGEMLRNVLPFSAAYCDGALVMPNLKRHEGDTGVLTGEDVAIYRAEILRAADGEGGGERGEGAVVPGGDLLRGADGLPGKKHQFYPFMTVKITDRTTPE